jgi:catechol 2,3-dioxygenase-like lactoylglutathione lyase family enzyme
MRTLRVAPLIPATPLVASGEQQRRCEVQRVLRVSRVVSDLGRAEDFYRDAMGFRVVVRGRPDETTLAVLGLTDARAEQVVMRLGADNVALVRFAVQGQPYPQNSQSDDLWFQHLAIVVSDMDVAYAHLARCGGWSPITERGPQLLPPENGAVRAFKFRDPDGHPLELIWFPRGEGRAVWHEKPPATTFLGIDHSAVSIASTPRSQAYYRNLGLRVTARSLNVGPAQARLDGLSRAHVRVTGLRPVLAGPELELLAYQPPGRPAGTSLPNDMTTDWITFAVVPSSSPSRRAARDPDGHLLILDDKALVQSGYQPEVR